MQRPVTDEMKVGDKHCVWVKVTVQGHVKVNPTEVNMNGSLGILFTCNKVES